MTVIPAPLPQLIPAPRRFRVLAGFFDLRKCPAIRIDPDAGPGVVDVALKMAARLAVLAGSRPEVTRTALARPGEVSLAVTGATNAEHHRLLIRPARAALEGDGEAGLFYAAQTFNQLIEQAVDGCVPALRIDDRPDYAVRGFYHDVCRGKVPTRETLLGLVETLARYKINQLQLYIEHTFAFARHPDIWAGSDPLTADDIRAIDEHAARHHVELVPSLSAFGHFYTALATPRKHHLNEFPIDASQLPFSWWDRMGHYTLDCRNPAALDLVREMILELRPLFRSKLFNLCCDETFDLGKGRNAAEAAKSGTGRLYLDFLKKLMSIVREAGCTPMFWGDIVGNHPELVDELPRPAIALDWDYSADLKDSKARLFKRAALPFYACPGVCGWDRWVNDLDTATANITAFARLGRRTGAAGLLNTDWGDRGHINCLGNSMHGLALGAAAGWNTAATVPEAFDRAFARLHWGDKTGRSTALMREAGRQNIVPWRLLTLWLDPTPHRPAAWWDERTDVPVELLAIDARRAFASAARLERIRRQFERRVAGHGAADPLARREWLLGCRGQALMNQLGGWIVCLAKGRQPPRGAPSATGVADELRRFEMEFSAVWHSRNRPSDYWRLRTALIEFARRLELAALRKVWVKTPRHAPPAAAVV